MPPAGSGSTPDLPATIGRYRIVARLSAERHDDVYEGFDPMIERPLVVKVFSLRTVDQPAADNIRQTFFSEMQRTGMLAHPGITTLFDAGEVPGGLFMASEYVEGESLDDQIDAVLAWPIGERVSLVVQLADALEYAREQGVPHLRLRPSHVLIAPDAAPKIRGFGVASVRDAIRVANGVEPIPSAWSAPERLAGERGDERADVYALAKIAERLLYDAADSERAAVDDVLQRAAAADPADRFQTAGTFKYALLLSLGLGEGEVRMAWEATREAGNILAADRGEPRLPQSAVNGDLTAMLGEVPTQLTPSGVEDLLTVLQDGENAQDPKSTKPA